MARNTKTLEEAKSIAITNHNELECNAEKET